ncbi:PREDICTED: uncharacterized protein LOC106788262 [Polistes canadensis]|uniref:uncharacterized protein LOC106788262 n=1 Tax=Polistes canadensis TaxID=91411 RepID=UPI000718DB82|nr:PREDICTED: uncharacterized protein LOC106788262 [Polistes canadensis]
MLTVMCPNCRLEFLADEKQNEDNCSETRPCTEDGWLMSEEQHTNDTDCLMNASTIINEQNIPKYSIQLDGSHNNDQLIKLIQTETPDSSKGPKCVNNKSTKNSYSSKRLTKGPRSDLSLNLTKKDREDCISSSICRITTCDLTGGSVTISTPNIQSGDCFIYNTDTCALAETPYNVIHPKLSVGGRFVETKMSTDDQDNGGSEKSSTMDTDNCGCGISRFREHIYSNEITMKTPSGCQELPGIRRNPSLKCFSEKRPIEDDFDVPRYNLNEPDSGYPNIKIIPKQDWQSSERNYIQEETTPLKHNILKQSSSPPLATTDLNNFFQNMASFCPTGTRPNYIDNKSFDTQTIFSERKGTMVNNGLPFNPSSGDLLNNSNDNESLRSSNGVQLQLNATLQLPADIEQCSVNITATRAANSSLGELSSAIVTGRSRNYFNGGGIVRLENFKKKISDECFHYNFEENEETPAVISPISWIMPVGLNNFLIQESKDHLMRIKKYLRACGWYHEGLSWQQSEILLKNVAIGRWLMRDSSDSRFIFAVSVQTERGPTSVRMRHVNGFRLDADPSLISAIPCFDCPIRLLEYYIEYSKRKNKNERRREVWVDYSGLLYGQIYLAEPLVKEVRSLSHLARLAINKHKLPTYNLPTIIRNYVLQYPYTI